MDTYSAYGLTIQSEFELPELPVGTNGPPDVLIRIADVDPVSIPPDGREERIRAEPGRCRMTSDQFGSFLVRSGEEILVDPATPDVDEQKRFRHLLQNTVLGVLLHQRGLLVLHASAVAIDGRAAVFLGPRGAGKSTTAVAAHLAGHTLLEDDVVAIDFQDDTPLVLPGVPETRLLPDSIDALGVREQTETSTDDGCEKAFVRTTDEWTSKPLAGCYQLSDGSPVRLEELPGRTKLFELISSTYARGLLSETNTSENHLRHCSRIIDTVPFKRLYRPHAYEALESVVELVVDDVRSNEGG